MTIEESMRKITSKAKADGYDLFYTIGKGWVHLTLSGGVFNVKTEIVKTFFDEPTEVVEEMLDYHYGVMKDMMEAALRND